MKPTKQVLVVVFTRQDVEARNINPAYEVLETLSSSTENAIDFRGSVAFMFEDYDSDEREIYEIQEIREYFNNLSAAWPYWGWFLELSASTAFLSVVISLLTPGESVTRGSAVAWRTNPKHVAMKAEDLLLSVDELSDRLTLPSSLVTEVKEKFADAMQTAFSLIEG